MIRPFSAKGSRDVASDNDVIQYPHIDPRQRVAQPVRQCLVGSTGFGIARRVRMRQDHCRRVVPKGQLDHFARIHRCLVQRAVEHLDVPDQRVLRIEQQDRENLMLVARELGAQVVLDRSR